MNRPDPKSSDRASVVLIWGDLRTVEFAVAHVTSERIPLTGGEDKRGSGRILGVADADQAPVKVRDLYAFACAPRTVA